MVQGLVASVAGGIIHRRFKFVSGELSLYMGGSIFIASLAGGAAARFISNRILLFIFACLGGYVSNRVSVRKLRLFLALVIGLAALRTWYQVLTGM